MSEATTTIPFHATTPKDALTEVVRIGAKRRLAAALEAEVEAYIEVLKQVLDEKGHRLVVRDGHLPERAITTGIGPIEARQPRVHDRRVDDDGERMRFTSSILPPYLRRTKSIDELIPWLFLKGVSSGGFTDALTSLLGPDAPGLSATSVVRLKQVWEKDYEEWSKRLPSAALPREQALRVPVGRRRALQHPPRRRTRLYFGRDRRNRWRRQGAARGPRRRAGGRAVVEGSLARPQGSRTGSFA